MNPSYAAFYMNSEFAKSAVRNFQVGVAQQHFNVGAMSEMPVPYPTLNEQREIVRRIEVAFSWINRLGSEAKNARKLLGHLDQAILAKAFRGELVPQDPNDEPASVLLARMKADRIVGKSKKVSDRKTAA
jgi:type I restriction enzyme S subunit